MQIARKGSVYLKDAVLGVRNGVSSARSNILAMKHTKTCVYAALAPFRRGQKPPDLQRRTGGLGSRGAQGYQVSAVESVSGTRGTASSSASRSAPENSSRHPGRRATLRSPMTRRGKRAQNNMSVTVGFDAAFDPGQLGVGQQLSQPAQVESPLFLVDWQFERQHRHASTLFVRACSVNAWVDR